MIFFKCWTHNFDFHIFYYIFEKKGLVNSSFESLSSTRAGGRGFPVFSCKKKAAAISQKTCYARLYFSLLFDSIVPLAHFFFQFSFFPGKRESVPGFIWKSTCFETQLAEKTSEKAKPKAVPACRLFSSLSLSCSFFFSST